MKNMFFLLFLFFLLAVFPFYANAYIEPGSGSLLIQALLTGFIGAIVVLKSYWYKILAFFSSEKTNDLEKDS